MNIAFLNRKNARIFPVKKRKFFVIACNFFVKERNKIFSAGNEEKFACLELFIARKYFFIARKQSLSARNLNLFARKFFFIARNLNLFAGK